jgi:hypothetical protein
MERQILRLERPELWHHGGEAIDAVEREPFVGTIECFKKPIVSQSADEANFPGGVEL